MIVYFCQGWTGWLFVTWMPSFVAEKLWCRDQEIGIALHGTAVLRISRRADRRGYHRLPLRPGWQSWCLWAVQQNVAPRFLVIDALDIRFDDQMLARPRRRVVPGFARVKCPLPNVVMDIAEGLEDELGFTDRYRLVETFERKRGLAVFPGLEMIAHCELLAGRGEPGVSPSRSGVIGRSKNFMIGLRSSKLMSRSY